MGTEGCPTSPVRCRRHLAHLRVQLLTTRCSASGIPMSLSLDTANTTELASPLVPCRSRHGERLPDYRECASCVNDHEEWPTEQSWQGLLCGISLEHGRFLTKLQVIWVPNQ